MRREFPVPVLRAIVERASSTGVIRCEGCGIDLTGKKYEIDHIIAEGLVPNFRKDVKLTVAEGQLLGECCHRGHEGKTAKDVKVIAKAKRQSAKFYGMRIKNRPKIESKGFEKIEKQRTNPIKVVPRRRMYE
jgi:hypothetical protein